METDALRFASRISQLGLVTPDRLAECLAMLQRLRLSGQDRDLVRFMAEHLDLEESRLHLVYEVDADPLKLYQPLGVNVRSLVGAGTRGPVMVGEFILGRVPVHIKIVEYFRVQGHHDIDAYFKALARAGDIELEGVVPILDVDRADWYGHYAQVSVAGRSLADASLDSASRRRAVAGAARLLQRLHDQGVIAGGLRAGDVFLRVDGSVCITDVGLPKFPDPVLPTQAGDVASLLALLPDAGHKLPEGPATAGEWAEVIEARG